MTDSPRKAKFKAVFDSLSDSTSFSLVLSFHALATKHPEWPAIFLSDPVSNPDIYPEIADAFLLHLTDLKLRGEL